MLRLSEVYFEGGPRRVPSGPQTSFASEQLIDELAFAAGIDPIAFRRQNISDDRWLGVMNAAAQASGWKPRLANSVKQSGDVVHGRGFGFGRPGSAGMAAAVGEIDGDKKTGSIGRKHPSNPLHPRLAV